MMPEEILYWLLTMALGCGWRMYEGPYPKEVVRIGPRQSRSWLYFGRGGTPRAVLRLKSPEKAAEGWRLGCVPFWGATPRLRTQLIRHGMICVHMKDGQWITYFALDAEGKELELEFVSTVRRGDHMYSYCELVS